MLGKLLKRRESSAEKDKEKDMPAQVATEATDTPAPASREEDNSTGQEEVALTEPVQAGGELSERQVNGPKTEDKKPDVSPVVAEGEAEEPQKEEGESAVFAGLFDDVSEKEETPVDRLIDSLPDVSAHELLDEMEEVTTIMRDWQRL